jgi:hypothetical protein
MRVDAVTAIPRRDQRANPAELDAAASLAVKNFLAALQNEDSLFNLEEPIRGPVGEESEKESALSGEMVLAFKERNLAEQKSLHFLLIEKLIELFKKGGSQETLEAKICVLGSSERQDFQGNALCIQLTAKGQSAAQAMLRWSLGLAQLQQAVLFISRYLRQQVARNEN